MVNESAVVVFDDERAVANAGVMLPALLAGRLGIERLVDARLDLGDRGGAANPGRKVMTMLSAMALGADCIEGCDILRSGQTAAVLGHRVAAPSTLGTFLRAFTFGHVRQLDRVLADSLSRAWAVGAGPGDERLVVDVDSFVGEVYGHGKQGAGFGYTRGAWLPLADRHARGHRRGPARAPQEVFGEQLARDAAFLRRADRARWARRRERTQAAARRLGVLGEQDLRPARPRRLAVLDRRPPASRRSRGDRADRRARLADTCGLPGDEHRADRRDHPERTCVDRD